MPKHENTLKWSNFLTKIINAKIVSLFHETAYLHKDRLGKANNSTSVAVSK